MTVNVATRWIADGETRDMLETLNDTRVDGGRLYTYQLTEHGQAVVSVHEAGVNGAVKVDTLTGLPMSAKVHKVFGPEGFKSIDGDYLKYDVALVESMSWNLPVAE